MRRSVPDSFPSTHPRRTAVAGVLALALLGGGLASTPASAAPRPSIAEVQARVSELNEHAESAAEAYNAGQIELQTARSAQRRSEASLNQARRTFDGQRTAIGQMAADAYRSGGSEQSSLSVLMTSDDPTSVIQKLSTLGAIQRNQASVLRRVEVARQGFAQAQAEATQRADQAETLATDLAAKKNTVNALLDQAQKQLAQLTAEERARIEAERKAKARAEALAAAQYLEQQQAKEAADAKAATDAAAAAAKARQDTRNSSTSSPSTSSESRDTAPATSTKGKGKAAGAVAAALSKLGSPYVWAAAGPNSFDCSGLIMWAYAQVGISVPHYTGAIWNGFPRVSKNELQPGDIVFFYGDVHHAGIYLGGGKMVHAPQTGDVVKISPAFWGRDYTGAVRIVG